MNIDKQALREEFQCMQDHYSDPADRDRQIIYIAAEALLDENIQLQREKDAIEAVALALRDDMRQAREQQEAAEKRIAEQREYYEGVIADGSKHIAELESKNGYLRTIAHEQNELAIRASLDSNNATVEMGRLHKRIAELEAKLETADKLQDSAFRDGLKAGFSYGQTDDQSGFTQCMSAYSPRAGMLPKNSLT
ncbi:TPA: ead/Ea22-like family protein [Salmonella enterica]|uniref:Ead/Ea22-like family protein n=2 Tax=Salmonella enterica TaxID=28901 RepID=A0A754EEP9_SALER|nr:ead/Ea22-like family protein [Salmonella enterica subsp. enterica serovar Newport str. CFSAN000599]EDU1195032.1 ead/Ea22-like family protein [Salmonella enterica subsp. enterica serovar Heidelberg str. CFSAN000576]HAF8580216.1 ead/Ea22-like family protein [Salmonella enterica]